MSTTTEVRGATPLTDEQRALVRGNVGLIAVHLKNNVPDLTRPSRHREWEDLFQEGCLGLMQAARLYRPECGMPFATFALPRIRTAVAGALRERFHLLRLP